MFNLDSLVSITMFNKEHASKIFDKVKAQQKLVVLKNNLPSAVIMSTAEYERLSGIEENYYLLNLANERLKNADVKNALSEREAMAMLNISVEDIINAEDAEIE